MCHRWTSILMWRSHMMLSQIRKINHMTDAELYNLSYIHWEICMRHLTTKFPAWSSFSWFFSSSSKKIILLQSKHTCKSLELLKVACLVCIKKYIQCECSSKDVYWICLIIKKQQLKQTSHFVLSKITVESFHVEYSHIPREQIFPGKVK